MIRHPLRLFAALLALLGPALAHAACEPAAPALSPSTINTTAVSGNAAKVLTSTLSVNCYYGESGLVYAAQDLYTGAVGSTGNALEARLYADAAQTAPLYTNPIAVSGTDSTASPNRINNVLYVRLSGPGGGPFTSYGSFSMSIPLELRAAATSGITLTVSGTIDGACSINNAAVAFGSFTNGTKPVRPVGITLNCTAGLPWSMSQPSIAYVGPGTGALNNTAWIFSNAGATTAIYDTPIIGTGTGAGQTVSTYVALHGSTRGTNTSGTGTVSGSVPVLVTY
jgi:hypothetical protein